MFVLLHRAHGAAPGAREAVATTGTSGDWGGGLALPALIRVTGRLLFSPVTCEVSSKAGVSRLTQTDKDGIRAFALTPCVSHGSAQGFLLFIWSPSCLCCYSWVL